jgi:membrane peptidoglycan carboxypeptidase
MNGTAVVIDPSNGRILAMVNQKLALSPGAEPCSTIKLTVAMAALSEGWSPRHHGAACRLPHEHDPGAGQEQQPLL